MSTRRQRFLIAVGAVALLAAACSTDPETDAARPSSETTGPTATPHTDGTSGDWILVEIVDGDTLRVRDGDGTEESVRIIGINTNESGECFAKEAADRLAELVGGGEIELITDESDRDRYDRLLRYVEVDGVDVGLSLVEDGYAMARRYEPDTTRAESLDAAQATAHTGQLGLWSPEACGPATTAEVKVSDLVFDPPGDDTEFLNGEWVEFVNGGEEPLDISGWMVRDESASNRYEVPSGVVLQPGIPLRLHTGCGQDTFRSLFWCSTGAAVWNNAGDTVFLLDASGNIVVAHRYEGA